MDQSNEALAARMQKLMGQTLAMALVPSPRLKSEVLRVLEEQETREHEPAEAQTLGSSPSRLGLVAGLGTAALVGVAVLVAKVGVPFRDESSPHSSQVYEDRGSGPERNRDSVAKEGWVVPKYEGGTTRSRSVIVDRPFALFLDLSEWNGSVAKLEIDLSGTLFFQLPSSLELERKFLSIDLSFLQAEEWKRIPLVMVASNPGTAEVSVRLLDEHSELVAVRRIRVSSVLEPKR